MKLSVIIVNYNVRYFLEQCLISVQNATKLIDAEVFVVDNSSVDGSIELIQSKFPWVKLIANTDNIGFSKANNIAIKQAVGDYILLLNPDTLVEEDTFTKAIQFMDKTPDAGGLGVKMIDGNGNFLPESKRALPTPKVAFYKIFGLSKLFPKSKLFGAYHLTYLDKNKIHEVDILSGAFMLIRKTVLDKVGLLDETFFMYGEDIDLSYRIIKAGYKNYYFPETRIIHYKGESTKKSSINYVVVFYKAMVIFAEKHFLSSQAKYLSFLINFAIYIRAFASIIKRILMNTFLPILDAGLIFGGLIIIRNNYELISGIKYDDQLTSMGIISYTVVWVISIFLAGGHDKPLRLIDNIKGVGYGLITILVFYSLLSEDFRFSRAIIVFGGLSTLAVTTLIRIILHYFPGSSFKLASTIPKRIAIIATPEEYQRLTELLQQTDADVEITCNVLPKNHNTKSTEHFAPNYSQLRNVIEVFKINEIIFSGTDNSVVEIIQIMSDFQDRNLAFKTVPKHQEFIIGSNSIKTTDEIYKLLNKSNINTNKNKRNKRIFDILASLLFLLLAPLFIWLQQNKFQFLKNLTGVLIGTYTFVGYLDSSLQPILPKIKKGIVSPLSSVKNTTDNEINFQYAKGYNYFKDLKAVIGQFNQLSRIL